MKDFLTLEDKIEYYQRLLWRQNYIQVLKQGLNPICFDELLSYILQVNREARRQLMFKIVNDNRNRNKFILKHTNFKFPEVWPDDPEYDYKFRLNYWLRTSTTIIQLFEDKQEPEKKSKQDQPKEYDSLVRARAFCIALLQESGKENFLDGKKLMKTKIKQFTEETWDGQSGNTVYDECRNIMQSKNPINEHYKAEHPKDFNFGKVLFNELMG
jgi:hypothetical protein